MKYLTTLLSSVTMVLFPAACGNAEEILIVENGNFLSTISEVPTVEAVSGDRRVALRVYGLEGALRVARSEGWNRRLTIMILSVPAYSQRGFFLKPATRITVDYTVAHTHAAALDDQFDNISQAQGLPIVQLAPPATFGSEGDFRDVYSESGIELINSAINALVERFGADEVILSGQSAAGVIVANLLPRRHDVACAVISSAPLDLDANERFNPAHDHYLGASEPINPIRRATEIPLDPDRTIYIGYSESDTIVDSSYQIEYANILKEMGHAVIVERATPVDNYGHDLSVWRLHRTLGCSRMNTDED